MRGTIIFVVTLVGGAWGAFDVPAAEIIVGQRTQFERALAAAGLESQIDTENRFASDPAVARSVEVVSRRGLMAGEPLAYDVYDVDFSNEPEGFFSVGVAGGDVVGWGRLAVERPASQGGQDGAGSWGVDSGGGGATTRNALLVDFHETPQGRGLSHFGVDLIDFEVSPAGQLGELRTYDRGQLAASWPFDWQSPDAGNRTTHFLGVIAGPGEAPFDQVLIVIGDDTPGGTGFREGYAADRFTFGGRTERPEPRSASVPEPGSLWIALAGALIGGLARRGFRFPGRALPP